MSPVPRKRPGLVRGLAAGVRRTGAPEMAVGVVDGAVSISDRINRAWKGEHWDIRQPCPVPGCLAGPYPSLESIRRHFGNGHAGIPEGKRRVLLDAARRSAVEQQMKMASRPP
jgi:hypothetical protein